MVFHIVFTARKQKEKNAGTHLCFFPFLVYLDLHPIKMDDAIYIMGEF